MQLNLIEFFPLQLLKLLVDKHFPPYIFAKSSAFYKMAVIFGLFNSEIWFLLLVLYYTDVSFNVDFNEFSKEDGASIISDGWELVWFIRGITQSLIEIFLGLGFGINCTSWDKNFVIGCNCGFESFHVGYVLAKLRFGMKRWADFFSGPEFVQRIRFEDVSLSDSSWSSLSTLSLLVRNLGLLINYLSLGISNCCFSIVFWLIFIEDSNLKM